MNMNTKAHKDSVTIAEAKNALSQATQLYFTQDAEGNYLVKRRRARPICFLGPAGIGKTEVVSQVAEEQGLALCSYSLVHHTRQSLLGLPRLETAEMEGEEVSVTRYTMSEIIDAIHQTMQKTGLTKGILFLDEFNCVNESIRPVMLQLLQEKSLGTHAIPDGWMLVLAGNPTMYNKSARDLDAVTMDRLRLIHLEPDLESWLPYANESGIHPTILNFLQENPQYFYQYNGGNSSGTGELVTPRGWEDMSIQLTMMEQANMEITPLFLGQFFQSSSMIHSFFLFYRRYAVLSGSGLLENIFLRKPESIENLQALSVQDRWALVTAVITRIKSLALSASQEESSTDRLYENLKSQKSVLKEGGAAAVDLLYALAEEESNIDIRPQLLNCADCVGVSDGWGNITQFFKEHIVAPLTERREKVCQLIDNALFLCNEGLRDAENVERLLHGIVDHKETVEFISRNQIPAFRELCSSTHFSDDSGLEELKKQLGPA